MLLPFTNGLVETWLSDPEMLALFRRHYSNKNHFTKKLGGPARSLLLRDHKAEVLFLWQWPQDGMRRDGLNGYNCAIFRNESLRRASEIILEAERFAVEKWGQNRFYTYVNPSKIKSLNPGFCFKKAGWKHVGESKSGLHLLAKENLK